MTSYFAPSPITAAQAANLDATISSRAPAATAVSNVDLTAARAANLDTTISSRAAIADYTSARALALDRILNGTTQVSVIRPDLALYVVLTTGTPAWTYGVYSQIVAANDLSLHSLTDLRIGGAAAGALYELQIAVGAVGSEVVIGTMELWGAAATEHPVLPVSPPLVIPANARIAARVASDAAGAQPQTAAWRFVPRPF